MDGSTTVELVLLEGGRASDDFAQGTVPRGDLRVVRGPSSDLQAVIDETVEAGRRIRREIETRIAAALDDLLRMRAPVPEPR